jgi:hypothetical protein
MTPNLSWSHDMGRISIDSLQDREDNSAACGVTFCSDPGEP